LPSRAFPRIRVLMLLEHVAVGRPGRRCVSSSARTPRSRSGTSRSGRARTNPRRPAVHDLPRASTRSDYAVRPMSGAG
jgi:hypothetical protein